MAASATLRLATDRPRSLSRCAPETAFAIKHAGAHIWLAVGDDRQNSTSPSSNCRSTSHVSHTFRRVFKGRWYSARFYSCGVPVFLRYAPLLTLKKNAIFMEPSGTRNCTKDNPTLLLS